ncbi:MATE family efflux transporter [Flexibacterium corallicola]|uniref:MATE family efflux transporter n=1 Tax=Flexibacterium corallicola TaxID=3037259 RepID=UPI00286FA13C|nr:MATE family efflux transporter [Pseudovibrio sp. M1P-2-3]
MVSTELSGLISSLANTLMVGRLGTHDLASLVLATGIVMLIYIWGFGVYGAVSALTSEAEGRGEFEEVGHTARMGVWCCLIISVCAIPVMGMSADILIFLGQNNSASRLAEQYLLIYQWSIYFSLIAIIIIAFLCSIDRAAMIFWFGAVAALMKVTLNFLLIFGWFGFPALGLIGAAIASVCADASMCFLLIFYSFWDKKARRCAVYSRFWRPDLTRIIQVFKFAFPISLLYLGEAVILYTAAIYMGWIGIVAVASHGIAMQILGVLYIFPSGITSAGVVRVAQAFGRGDREAIAYSGWTLLGVSIVIALLLSPILIVYSKPMASFFISTQNPHYSQIISLTSSLLLIGALILLPEYLQLAAASALRGLSDTRMPMLLSLLCYIGVSIPLAYILGFWLGMGPVGIWIGLGSGFALAAALLVHRFIRREKLNLVKGDKVGE